MLKRKLKEQQRNSSNIRIFGRKGSKHQQKNKKQTLNRDCIFTQKQPNYKFIFRYKKRRNFINFWFKLCSFNHPKW